MCYMERFVCNTLKRSRGPGVRRFFQLEHYSLEYLKIRIQIRNMETKILWTPEVVKFNFPSGTLYIRGVVAEI